MLQSIYTVESFFSQNAFSAASLANFGIGLRRLFINRALLPMHVSGRYHPDQVPGISQSNSNVQSPPFMGLTEGMKAWLYRLGRRPVDTDTVQPVISIRTKTTNPGAPICPHWRSVPIRHLGVVLSHLSMYSKVSDLLF